MQIRFDNTERRTKQAASPAIREFDREAIAPLNRTRLSGGNDLRVLGCVQIISAM
jgi:hypothetical protein